MENKTKCRIGAIIVTYNPDKKLLFSNIDKYQQAFEELLIVDNSPGGEPIMIPEIFTNVKLLTLGENKGIAYAQNRGIEYFQEKEIITHIMFFDQDSFLTTTQVEDLLEKLEELSIIKKIGLIGPTPEVEPKSKEIIEVNQTLSSGSLSRKEVFAEIGQMNEELFIDMVDYDWCWRAIEKGYKIIVDQSTVINHQFGDGKSGVFGLSRPFRLYYQFRNTIYMMKQKVTPTSFKVKYAVVLPVKFLYFSLFVKDRKERRKYMIQGIKDGFSNTLGPINS